MLFNRVVARGFALVFLGISGFAAGSHAQHNKVTTQISEVNTLNSTVVPGEIVVGIAPEQVSGYRPQILASMGSVIETQPTLRILRVHLNPGQSMETALTALRAQPGVRYAEPNHYLHVTENVADTAHATATAVANDPYYGYQWAVPQIQADKAWAQWQPVQNIVVAIVDTGVDSTHPDLINQMYRDSSGIVGYNAFTQKRDIAMDVYGHGTHCAGIVAAQVDNGIGVAGIGGVTTNFALKPSAQTPQSLGFGISIMPVRVMDNTGSGTDVTVAEGIIWAVNNGAKVISMSIAGPDDSITLDNACTYAWSKGCVLVAAAGNSGVSTKYYPAASPDVLAVGASDSSDTLTGFSNWGNWVAVVAPGDTILSTLPSYQVQPTWPLNYAYMSGTSMAAPHVAAEAAMILAAYPHITNSHADNLIIENVDPCAPYGNNTLASGVGRINLLKALNSAANQPSPPTAPSGLKAQVVSGTVVLNWQASPSTINYNVMRATRASGPFSIMANAVPFLTFTDRSVLAGTTYYYQIAAENSVGLGPNSSIVSVSVPAPPKMTAPSGLTVTVNTGSNTLSWHLPPTATSKTPIRIYRATGAFATLTLLQTVTGATQFSDTQVKGGVSYTYAVTAIDTNGQETPRSNTISVVAKATVGHTQ